MDDDKHVHVFLRTCLATNGSTLYESKVLLQSAANSVENIVIRQFENEEAFLEAALPALRMCNAKHGLAISDFKAHIRSQLKMFGRMELFDLTLKADEARALGSLTGQPG